ncbi:MAG: carboxypeptidase regulatory-like domain-containing protein [Planctomycetota bacterium]|nr:carboxypeptidase regulatory-like domain-containing protein [Planctomycetota bacterium]
MRNVMFSYRSLVLLAVLAPSAHAQISGQVLDSLSLAPIGGALVTLQATTTRTTTAADGTYTLPIASGANLTIVAANKGHYNASISTSAPSTGNQILLEAVPTMDNGAYPFLTPTNCGMCHYDQLAEWIASPMAEAGQNTWVYDVYNGLGSPGGLGGFVYTRDSVFAATNPNSECAACHQPEPWIMSPGRALEDISQLSASAMHGISCEVCHKIAHIDESKLNFPGIFPGVVEFSQPYSPDQVEYGVFGDSDINMGWMRSSYQPQLTATMCAACHQDSNDHDEDGDFEDAGGVISEPTYYEWLATPYADPADPRAATCVTCHMPGTEATKASSLPFAPTRQAGQIREHRIVGTTPEFLENSCELKVRPARQVGRYLNVDVFVTNTGAGHHVPTGVTVRNMILLVEAWRISDGQKLKSVGSQMVHDLGGIGDPALGYYAGLPGKLFAKVNHDAAGNGPTFYTDATGILWDNRIPALATDESAYRFVVPPGSGELRVRARLIYRRAFRSFVDAKQWTTTGHGQPLEDIAAPYYGHLMEEEEVRLNVPTGVR